MLMRHVSNHSHIKVASDHTPLRQAMGSCFQDAVGQASLNHLIQVILNVRSFRRGDVKSRIEHRIANASAHR